jgi:dihydrofolate reductase
VLYLLQHQPYEVTSSVDGLTIKPLTDYHKERLMEFTIKPLSIIVAVDLGLGFGYQGEIPWKTEPFAKTDFKHFQQTTKDSVCIMGRNTYQEILDMTLTRKTKEEIDSILPGRICYVISRNKNLEVVGATVVQNLRSAIQNEQTGGKEIFVIGGEKLFVEALSWTDTIYMTVVKNYYKCDRVFPAAYLDQHFTIVDGTQTDDLHFLTYKRTKR